MLHILQFGSWAPSGFWLQVIIKMFTVHAQAIENPLPFYQVDAVVKRKEGSISITP